jgi:hypothetical protein
MSSGGEVTYALDFAEGKKRKEGRTAGETDAAPVVPRLARLMALAIRFERLVGDGKMRNFAEIARLGHVTRGRMTQIMKLRLLAPDIQEELLFLPGIRGWNERNIRAIVKQVDWSQQRRLFRAFQKRART